MGSEEADLMEEGGGGVGETQIAAPPDKCSICFEAVVDKGGRSWATLQCEHKFHLDCIGSAFNVKGLMQCPNCRKIEKGQWLYANGSRSCPEFSIDDWTHAEDIYDLSFSEVPFGFHWCPFGGLTRIPSSFEERERVSNAYHDLLGHHAIFPDHTVAHACPYFTYFQPLQSSSSNSNEGSADDSSFGHHWSSLSGPSDMSSSHTVPAVDLHYHMWDRPTPHFSNGSRLGGADQTPVPSTTLRSSRGDSVHPLFLNNGTVSPAVPPYPGGNSGTHHDHAYHQHQQLSAPNMRLPMLSAPRRSSGPRAPIGPVASSSDRSSAFYVRNLQQADSSMRSHFYAWERDRFAPFPLIPVDRESSWWGPFPRAANDGSSSVWHSNGSERTPLSRTENPPHQQGHPNGSLHPFI